MTQKQKFYSKQEDNTKCCVFSYYQQVYRHHIFCEKNSITASCYQNEKTSFNSKERRINTKEYLKLFKWNRIKEY